MKILNLVFLCLPLLFTLVCAHVHLDFVAHKPKNIDKRESVEATLENREVLYVADFKVGSQQEPVKLWLDTRISTLFFPTTGCSYNVKRDTRRDTETSTEFTKKDDVYDVENCDLYGIYTPEDLSASKIPRRSSCLTSLVTYMPRDTTAPTR